MTSSPGGAPDPRSPGRRILLLVVPEEDREFFEGDLEEGLYRPWWRELRGALGLRLSRTRGRAPGGRGPGLHLSTDVRLGLRHMARSPAATLAVLTALAVGIGLSTVMFSLIRGGVLPTLPFEAGDRIVRVQREGPEGPTAAELVHWRSRQRSFEGLAAWTERSVTLSIEGAGIESVQGAAVEPALFTLLSVGPLLGRIFTAADAEDGAPLVVLLGYRTWTLRFEADPGVVGRMVRVGGEPAQVVGVMPPGFAFPWNQGLWTPLRLDPLRSGSAARPLSAFGVLRRGATVGSATAELQALDRADPSSPPRPPPPAEVRAFTDIMNPAGMSRVLAGTLLAVGALVLLVACANAANILLARSVVRGREVAIRVALGASRLRIATQFWSEILVLALLGALGGAGLAAVAIRLIRNAVPPDAGMPFWFHPRLDLPILGFAAASAVVAAVAAGVAPILRASRTNRNDLLQDGSRGSSSRRLGVVMRRLIGLEMAVSFVLLVAAGLFIRSAVNLRDFDFPFEPGAVHTVHLQIPEDRYPDLERRAALFRELEATLAAMPGASSAAVTTGLPGIGTGRSTVVLEGIHDPNAPDLPEARRIAVSPGFFPTFGAAATTGRILDEGDREEQLPVAVVNRAFQERHLPDGAVGHRLAFPASDGSTEWITIVGVVPDLLAGGLERTLEEAVYTPLAQQASGDIAVAVRSSSGAAALAGPVRETLLTVDGELAQWFPRSLESAIEAANAQYRWLGALFLVAGALALFLAAIGLYGVMAFWVAQRTREIGVRMAVGGSRGRIMRLVIREAMGQVAVGLLIGAVVALPLAWLLHGALLDVRPLDPLVFGTVLGVLVLAGWVGCAFPALRATRIEPQRALAAE